VHRHAASGHEEEVEACLREGSPADGGGGDEECEWEDGLGCSETAVLELLVGLIAFLLQVGRGWMGFIEAKDVHY
jgi:hypothetical protein